MTTAQLAIFGGKETTTDINETIITDSFDLEEYFNAVIGKSEEQEAYDAANAAFNEFYPTYQHAATRHLNGVMSDEAYLEVRSTYYALLAEVDKAEAAL
jgi:hypothetical protein